MAGYSTTPLYKKLGLKNGLSVRVIDSPIDYLKFFDSLLVEFNILESDIEGIDLVHIFVTDLQKLEEYIQRYKMLINKNGAIWISWPKISSKIQTNLNENIIRELAIKEGLVDVKVCAVDESWSGLKLVYRIKDR